MTEDRHTCTKENPWTKDKLEGGIHPDAIYLYDSLCDEYEVYECPHCKLKFKKLLPSH